MPELPEVEFAASRLRRWMTGRPVRRAAATAPRLLRGQSPEDFARALTGRALERVERRGKYLLLFFDAGAAALAHLGMTGKFVREPTGTHVRFGHARFELEDGWTVHLRDPRKFGRIEAIDARQLEELPELRSLGPDATPLPARRLAERLRRTARPLKIALMDQTIIAGLGNIHAAEALFRSGLDPERPADSLTPEEITRLARGIRSSIAFALARMPAEGELEYVEEPGAPNPFLVYGKAGEPCPKCGARLRSFVQGGRTTYWCRRCQR